MATTLSFTVRLSVFFPLRLGEVFRNALSAYVLAVAVRDLEAFDFSERVEILLTSFQVYPFVTLFYVTQT